MLKYSNTLCLIFAALIAQSGCSALPFTRDKPREREAIRVVGLARVTEGILEGQRLNIPETGLTLGEAVYSASRPGSLEGEAVELVSAASFWVEIRRGASRIFIPLPLVQNSIAGSIQVSPGDTLNLWPTPMVGHLPGVDADLKLIPIERPSRVGTFTVAGLYPTPGVYSSTEDDPQGLRPRSLRTLQENAQKAGEAATIVLLSRNIGPISDQYIIPIKSADNPGVESKLVDSVDIRDGDTLTFTRLELLDMALVGARKAQLAREAIRREDQRERETICDRIDERLDQSNGITRKLHDSMESTRERVKARLSRSSGASFVPL